jgi:two-component system cell cycle sensor histidine kinase/response regulator CckA
MENVLLLEDDLGCRQGISAILQLTGYHVTEAATVDQALEFVGGGQRIDLFVTDVGLQDMSGPDVALQVVKRQPELPVLLVSGTPPEGWNSRDRSLFSRLQAYIVDFLEKPFLPAVLYQKLRALLERRARFTANRSRCAAQRNG